MDEFRGSVLYAVEAPCTVVVVEDGPVVVEVVGGVGLEETTVPGVHWLQSVVQSITP